MNTKSEKYGEVGIIPISSKSKKQKDADTEPEAAVRADRLDTRRAQARVQTHSEVQRGRRSHSNHQGSAGRSIR